VYILWAFGIFFPALEKCTSKNLAALIQVQSRQQNVAKSALAEWRSGLRIHLKTEALGCCEM
jgi:hypothetical protein